MVYVFTVLVMLNAMISARHVNVPTYPLCPFDYKSGEPCLRSAEMLARIDAGTITKNLRPEIPKTDITESERKSDRLCCYERECLTECGVHLNYSDTSRSIDAIKRFQKGLPELIKIKNRFFKNIKYNEISSNNTNIVDNWIIKVAHFYNLERNYKATEKLLRHLDKVVN